MDVTFGGWTSFTFIVMDANSAEDRKCILCCNAPDIGEKGDEVVLKSVRMPFAEAAPSMVSFEMMTMAPSESNEGQSSQCCAASVDRHDGYSAWRTEREDRNTRRCEGGKEKGFFAD
jgi:hypothetical protein